MSGDTTSHKVNSSTTDLYTRMISIGHNLATPFGIILLIVFGIISIASLLGNGFIIVVNCHRWVQSRKLSPCDGLLTCLSIFRFLLQCFTLSGQYIYVFSPKDYLCNSAWQGVGMAWIFFNTASALGTSCLIFYYCVKVTTFSHPLFLWLRSRIDKLVYCMLVISLIVFAFAFIFPFVSFLRSLSFCNLPRNLTANTNQTEASGEPIFMVFKPLQVFFTAFNFSICLTASILLLISLWRHIRNLKSILNSENLSTQAHTEVIKQLVLFLFLYVLNFVSTIIAVVEILVFGTIERLISDTVTSFFPSTHCFILIWTNPRLKRAFGHILHSRERSS